ncbi:hypothetical protein ACEPAI_3188 [Sanghuangporus weigelae]
MINNPDLQPNVTINRWIAAEEDPPPDETYEDWVDETYGFAIEEPVSTYQVALQSGTPSETATENPFPSTESVRRKDSQLDDVTKLITHMKRPDDLSDSGYAKLIRYAADFFVKGGHLWRKARNGRHQVVIDAKRRWDLVKQAHDDLGHKGVFSTRMRLLERFWWPSLGPDVKYFVRTCHECQIRQTKNILIPPNVPEVAPLFQRIHIDSKVMPKSGGFRYIVHARCSLTAYPEFRLLREETGRTVGQFIFQNLLCRYGACPELVTDNGTPFVAALDYLKTQYHINHIRISSYNSRANGLVEHRHFDIQEALIKAADGNDKRWSDHADSVFWAERITINKATGMSPYYMAHGVEAVLPFDLAEATYLAPPLDSPVSTSELIVIRAKQLQKRPEELDRIARLVMDARHAYAKQFAEMEKHKIKDYDFQPGNLVLLRNTRIKMELNRKTKPHYLGPYVVVRRTQGGSYIIAKLDGAVSKLRVAAFRLIPYFPRSHLTVPVTKLVGSEGDDEIPKVEDSPEKFPDDESQNSD